ncbi:MAG: hypothetical protein K0R54_5108 [Clostridiaceae bacterium]|jgi:hypothetical protein|nr:hypothetical protein [Clostridiaceae bacterium]
MNCREENHEKHSTSKHNPIKHLLHMILCCGLPIVIIGLLPVISRFSPSTGGVLARVVPFLCPIMMLSMLPMMLGGKKESSCCDNKNHNVSEEKPLEMKKL